MKAERDLRSLPTETLTNIHQQLRKLQQIHSTPVACPACFKPVNAYEASGRKVEDEDGAYQGQYHCPHCRRELKLVVPFISVEPYLWQLAKPLPPEPRQPGEELSDDCEHQVHEDCLICCVCGRCRESLDENGVCSECRTADENDGGAP